MPMTRCIDQRMTDLVCVCACVCVQLRTNNYTAGLTDSDLSGPIINCILISCRYVPTRATIYSDGCRECWYFP